MVEKSTMELDAFHELVNELTQTGVIVAIDHL